MLWLFDFFRQIANMSSGHGAVTDKEIRVLLIDLANHGACNFNRLVMGLGLYRIGAVMTRAALNGIDIGIWHQI